MKKFIFFAACVSFSFASLFNVSGGYGYEQQVIDGYVKGDKGKNYFKEKKVDFLNDPYTGYFGLKNKTNPYFWIEITNNIKYLPNIKFKYTKYETSGHTDYIASNVTVFGKVSVNTILTDAEVYMAIDSYDLSMFYNFNTKYGKVGAGVGADYWKGKFKIYDNKTKKYRINYEGSLILPYLYGEFEKEIVKNLLFLANAKIVAMGDKHHYDVLGAFRYNINFKYLSPFVKLGYKYKEAYYKDENDNTTKLSYEGIFFEIGAKF